MESMLLLAIIIKILFICLQISTFTGMTLPFITTCCRKRLSVESDIDVREIKIILNLSISSYASLLIACNINAQLVQAVILRLK